MNTASIGGLVGIAGRAAYHASKHGVPGLTKNAVCPGIIETPMVAGMLASESEERKELMKQAPIGRLGRTCTRCGWRVHHPLINRSYCERRYRS